MNSITNFVYNKKVLVADDDAINQFVVQHILTSLGAKTELVSNGAELVNKLKDQSFDLVLMDIQMPEMDGYAAAQYVRNQLQNNVPIIAMTAFALKGEEEKCLSYGMNGYVSKPFTAESFKAAIDKAFLTPYDNLHSNPYVFRNENVTVDISILYDVAGDDKNYIDAMLRTFIENMPQSLNKINEGCKTENWDEVYKAAHYAKSSLSIIKVNKMFEAVLEIETLAKHRRDLHKIPELFSFVKGIYGEAEKVIEEQLPQTK